jgi:hypothetical protein
VDPREYAAPLRAYALSRLLVLACAAVSVVAFNPKPARGPWNSYGGPHVAILQALGRWDGAWYLEVAHNGYQPIQWGDAAYASQAFFPGYPMLVRLFSTLTFMPTLLAGVVVTTAVGAIAATLAWRVVADVASVDAANRAVFLFCFSPGAFVLSMAYSEALFLVGALATLLFLLRRNWWAAGSCAAIASFTRPNGFALAATCAIVAAVALYRERDRSAVIAAVLAPLGALAYFGYLWVRTGHTLAWFTVEREGWGDRVAPLSGLLDRFASVFVARDVSLEPGGLNDATWLAFAVIGAACVVLLLQWRPPLPILAYGLTAAAMAVSSYQVGLRPRMLLVAFPLVLAVGVRLRERAYAVALGASATVLVAYSLLTFSSLAVFP